MRLLCKVTPVILHGVVSPDTTPFRMTGVTLHTGLYPQMVGLKGLCSRVPVYVVHRHGIGVLQHVHALAHSPSPTVVLSRRKITCWLRGKSRAGLEANACWLGDKSRAGLEANHLLVERQINSGLEADHLAREMQAGIPRRVNFVRRLRVICL